MIFLVLLLSLFTFILLDARYKKGIFKFMIALILTIMGIFLFSFFWVFILIGLIFSYIFSKFNTNNGRTYYQTTKLREDYMTEKEAREILGVGEEATTTEINKAFKNLIMINHPDKGGSKYLANRIILARDTLTKKTYGA